MALSAKEKHRAKLLEYLSDPDKDFPKRETMSIDVLKFKYRQQIHRVFTPGELQEIEQEALENRRKKYANKIAKIDKALMDRAEQGDPQAIKLVYQRFEQWSEKHEVKGNPPVQQNNQIIVQFIDANDSDSTED